jgi:putative salt-induced outer membrane protein YdiY
MQEALIETLYEQFRIGKGTDGGGFKAEAWTLALEAVRKAHRGNSIIEEVACRNKWTWFKDTWKNWKLLGGMSGFGWDEEEELYKADKGVWDGLTMVWNNLYLILDLFLLIYVK